MSTLTLLFPLHNNWSSQIGILRMTEVVFLLFTLVLNFGQATTCEADTCQGEYYLENHGLFLKPGTKISVSRTVFKTGLTISGGFGTETNIETFPDKVNCTIPPFPAPGNCSCFSSHLHDVTFISQRETLPLPVRHQERGPCGMRWFLHQEVVHLLAHWPGRLD